MSEKSGGQILWESINDGLSITWTDVDDHERSAFDGHAEKITGQLRTRIEELTAEVSHWRRKADEPKYRVTAECLVNDMKFDPPSPDMILAMKTAADWHGSDVEDDE